MKYYNMVRQRAGISEASSVTFVELLKERRRELAFESQTWFDTQRYRYREGNAAALELLNSGYATIYKIVDSKADGAQYDKIIISESAFTAPIPAAVSSSSPALSGAPVDYYGGAAE